MAYNSFQIDHNLERLKKSNSGSNIKSGVQLQKAQRRAEQTCADRSGDTFIMQSIMNGDRMTIVYCCNSVNNSNTG